MPRYNVPDAQMKKWRCFSTVVDDWITDWMSEEQYERWRQKEYGFRCGTVREANLMSLEEALERIAVRIANE